MINVQDIDSYPENYDNVPQEIQTIIISYMNGMQQLAKRYYQKFIDKNDLAQYNLYAHTLTSLSGSKNAYASLGIMTEYNWKGHPGEWFLATREDAEQYDPDWEETIPDIIQRDLLDYLDVGI